MQPQVMCQNAVDFFGQPDDVLALQKVYGHEGQLDVAGQVRLAWYLRQRDTQEAMKIVRDLWQIYGDLGQFDDPDLAHFYARTLLIEAEYARLFVKLDVAAVALKRAEERFLVLNDALGLGDCALMKADILLIEGDIDGSLMALRMAMGHYKSSSDGVRFSVATAWLANQEQYHNVGDALALWNSSAQDFESGVQPGVLAYMSIYNGSVAFQAGDFAQAIRFWEVAFDDALASGALCLAIHAATVIGAAYANLFDLSTALEWKEKAYSIAKPTGWPEYIGRTLASMAETTTSLCQYSRAEMLFSEAMPYLDMMPGSRRHSIAYSAYGHLHMALSNPGAALYWYQRAEAIAERLGHPDVKLLLGSAITRALVELGRLEEAEQCIVDARHTSDARGNPYYEIEALRALASVRRAQGGRSSEAIGLLREAVSLGATLEGMTLRTDVYDELARDYEAVGDFQSALHFERRARESWQKNFDQQNGARIQALQVRFDTARAKAEMEHHRKLAEAEAARAAELGRSSQVLKQLGAIGQEITARLDGEAVFATLARHLHELMQANTLFLGLTDDAKQIIDIRYRMEDGKRLPRRQVPLASDNLSARCVRNNEEILVSWDELSDHLSVPGTRVMRTVLFRPLTLGDKVVGVVSVQSDQPDAYGPRERLIFSTICAYGAIAMANAEAYHQLDRAVGETQEALQRLVQQEKMAALGQLVAGVAHEVNTPLGVTLSAVSQLNDNLSMLHSQIEKGILTRSALTESLYNGRELADLAQRNVTRAADMIRTFKGVAVDHGNDERRMFDLAEYVAEVMSLIRARVVGYGNRIDIDVPSIEMDTYPGALSQAITNLVTNVSDHAYSAERPGVIQIRGQILDPCTVEIAVIDQGVGIAADILPKVFDPFFTTRRATGSMGLGLHVAFNQVTQRLGGSITIESAVGQGTVAILRIPCEVPGGITAGIGAIAGKGTAS